MPSHINLDVTEYIKGKKVEYQDDTHTYFVDGIQVPSVTQIISSVLPSPYKHIEPTILKQAANRGLALHKEIERFEQQGIQGTSVEFKNYLYLKKKHQIESVENEKLVLIAHEGRVVCAGRLDMIIRINGDHQIGIGDVKRTSQIYFEHVSLQLNLYRIGYMQSYGKDIKHLHCFHLKHFTKAFIEIPIDEDYAYSALHRYLEKKNV